MSRSTEATDFLHLYLQDHEAASAGGVRLIDRCHQENLGTPFEAPLAEISLEIEQEQLQLQRLMEEVGASPSTVKRTAARVGETVARLVPNGRVRTYSPLSRVLELEALSAAITGKLRLWQALHDLSHDDERLEAATFVALQDMARAQLASIEAMHRLAVQIAFVDA